MKQLQINLQLFKLSSVTIKHNDDGTTSVTKTDDSGKKTTSQGNNWTSTDGKGNYEYAGSRTNSYNGGGYSGSSKSSGSSSSSSNYSQRDLESIAEFGDTSINAKNAMNDYYKSNGYMDDYGNVDYAKLISEGVANKASINEISNLLQMRNAKIAGNSGQYGVYANDPIQELAQRYINQGINKQNQAKYDKLDDKYLNVLDDYQNQKFSYDYKTDPMYEIYKNIYTRMAEDAQADTLADASALTGGLPSSYAVSAAAQAKNNYMQKIADIVPTLEQAAYEKFKTGKSQTLDYLDRLQSASNTAYQKYLDELDYQNVKDRNNRNDYESDRNYRFNMEQFDYSKEQDARAYEQWLAEFDEKKRQALVNESIAKGQLSVSQGNLALANAKFAYEKEYGSKGADNTERNNNYQIGLSDINSGNLTVADLDDNYDAYVDAMGLENYNKLYDKALSKEKGNNSKGGYTY